MAVACESDDVKTSSISRMWGGVHAFYRQVCLRLFQLAFGSSTQNVQSFLCSWKCRNAESDGKCMWSWRCEDVLNSPNMRKSYRFFRPLVLQAFQLAFGSSTQNMKSFLCSWKCRKDDYDVSCMWIRRCQDVLNQPNAMRSYRLVQAVVDQLLLDVQHHDCVPVVF